MSSSTTWWHHQFYLCGECVKSTMHHVPSSLECGSHHQQCKFIIYDHFLLQKLTIAYYYCCSNFLTHFYYLFLHVISYQSDTWKQLQLSKLWPVKIFEYFCVMAAYNISELTQNIIRNLSEIERHTSECFNQSLSVNKKTRMLFMRFSYDILKEWETPKSRK